MQTIDKAKVDEIIDELLGNNDLTASPEVWYGLHQIKNLIATEIITCKGCKNYEWMSNRIPEEQTWHCHCWDADIGKDDFCSYAERRTDD